MKRILLMLLAVFAIGGGNLWATDTTVDIDKRLPISGGTATISDASFEIKMDGWQNFVIFDNAEGVAIDGTSTIVVGMTETTENQEVRLNITFAPDEGEDFNEDFWWLLGVGNDINDQNTHWGQNFDGATWYFKKGVHEYLKSKGYYDSGTDTYKVKVKKVTINNHNAGAHTYLLSGEGNVASAPLNISKGYANSMSVLSGSITVPGIDNAAFKFENLDVKNYHTLRIEFEEALSDGWSFYIGTSTGMDPNIHMNENVYELNIDDLKTIEGESETLNELTLLRSSEGAATAKIKSITLYGEETITVKDYVELPISEMVTTGNSTIEGEVITFGNDGGAGWSFDSPQDWRGYKYLVVVPKRRYVQGGQVEGSGAGTINAHVDINGKETRWNGGWNPKRAVVIDLTSTWSGTDFTRITNNITSVFIKRGYVNGDWTISAAYLTNNAPKYSDSNGNNGDNGDTNLGDAETNADHVRTLSTKGTLGVVCLPYASAICGADAFEFVGVNDRENPTAIWVRPVVGLLEAGKPYIFETNTNLNVTFYRAGAHEEATAGSDNGLVGVFDDGTVTGNQYVVSGGEFKKGKGTTSIKANRAYLDLDAAPVYATPAEAQARGCINIMGDETAIESIFGTQKSNAIYDLNGRRVENPTRGFYIMGGKKYIVK